MGGSKRVTGFAMTRTGLVLSLRRLLAEVGASDGIPFVQRVVSILCGSGSVTVLLETRDEPGWYRFVGRMLLAARERSSLTMEAGTKLFSKKYDDTIHVTYCHFFRCVCPPGEEDATLDRVRDLVYTVHLEGRDDLPSPNPDPLKTGRARVSLDGSLAPASGDAEAPHR